MDKKMLLATIIVLLLGISCIFYIKHVRKIAEVQPEWTPPATVEEEIIVEEEETASEPQSYQDAVKLSEKTGKKIVLYFTAEWCGGCKSMKRTFEDANVIKVLENYIVYKADVDKEKELTRQFGIHAIPAYHIIDKKHTVKEGIGFKHPKEFIRWLEDKNTGHLRLKFIGSEI